VQSIREGGDNGAPVAAQPGHPAAAFYASIAESLTR